MANIPESRDIYFLRNNLKLVYILFHIPFPLGALLSDVHKPETHHCKDVHY